MIRLVGKLARTATSGVTHVPSGSTALSQMSVYPVTRAATTARTTLHAPTATQPVRPAPIARDQVQSMNVPPATVAQSWIAQDAASPRTTTTDRRMPRSSSAPSAATNAPEPGSTNAYCAQRTTRCSLAVQELANGATQTPAMKMDCQFAGKGEL